MRKRTRFIEHWRLMRPRQWTKNIFVLSPLFFSFAFLEVGNWLPSLIAVLCFIALSASVYIVNDINDRDEDRTHPRKKYRPLAAKTITSSGALLQMAGLLMFAFSAALLFLPMAAVQVMLAYLAVQAVYSFHFKKILPNPQFKIRPLPRSNFELWIWVLVKNGS